MYLEILTVAHDTDDCLGSFTSQIRIFVGPFKSRNQRHVFRERWERRLNSGNSNPHQVKFLSQEKLPDGWGALPPDKFRGFNRIVWDEEEGDYKEA